MKIIKEYHGVDRNLAGCIILDCLIRSDKMSLRKWHLSWVIYKSITTHQNKNKRKHWNLVIKANLWHTLIKKCKWFRKENRRSLVQWRQILGVCESWEYVGVE